MDKELQYFIKRGGAHNNSSYELVVSLNHHLSIHVVLQMEGPTLGRNLWVSDPKYLQTHVTGHGQHGMPKAKAIYESFKVVCI